MKLFVKRHALCKVRNSDMIIHGVNKGTETPH